VGCLLICRAKLPQQMYQQRGLDFSFYEALKFSFFPCSNPIEERLSLVSKIQHCKETVVLEYNEPLSQDQTEDVRGKLMSL
jgi:hypothetical protein